MSAAGAPRYRPAPRPHAASPLPRFRVPPARPLAAIAAAWCCAGAFAGDAAAGDSVVVVEDLTVRVDGVPRDLVGVGGYVRPGAWGPLGPVTGGGGPAWVSVTDGDGLTLTRPVRIDDGATGDGAGRDRGSALFQAGRAGSPIVVRFGESPGAAEMTWTFRPGEDFAVLGPEDRLWAAVDLPAASILGADEDGGPLDGGGGRYGFPVRVAAFASAGQLPAVPGGLDTVRVLFAETGDGLAGDAGGAVARWVTGGGHLVLSLAPGGTDDLPGFVPVEVLPARPLTAQSVLETVAERGSGLGGAAALNRLVPAVARPVDPESVRAADGRVLAGGDGGALVAEVPVGLGRVTVVAASLHAAPLRTWAGLPGFLKEVTRRGPANAASDSRRGGSGGELAGQVFAALEDRGGAAAGGPLSPGAAGLLVLLTVLIVGPLDYLLVHRLLGRPALTWVTLPVWLAAVGGAAWAAGDRPVPGPRRLEIVDVDAAAGRVRGAAWASVPAPAGGRADVRFGPAASPSAGAAGGPAGVRLGYAADPGGGFGGLYRAGGAGLVAAGYAVEGGEAVGVPLPEGAATRLRADWGGTVAGPVVSSALAAVDGRLRGEVAHSLPGTLSDVLLVYGGRVYRPDPTKGLTADALTLDPGEPFRPDGLAVERRDLRGFLTQVRRTRIDPAALTDDAAASRQRLVSSRYDPASRDFSLILPLVSFHERAGGRGYTGLTNAELEPLDLSPLAATGRAILLGRLDAPLTDLAVDFGGAPVPAGPAVTYVRVVLPVADRAPPAPGPAGPAAPAAPEPAGPRRGDFTGPTAR